MISASLHFTSTFFRYEAKRSRKSLFHSPLPKKVENTKKLRKLRIPIKGKIQKTTGQASVSFVYEYDEVQHTLVIRYSCD